MYNWNPTSRGGNSTRTRCRDRSSKGNKNPGYSESQCSVYLRLWTLPCVISPSAVLSPRKALFVPTLTRVISKPYYLYPFRLPTWRDPSNSERSSVVAFATSPCPTVQRRQVEETPRETTQRLLVDRQITLSNIHLRGPRPNLQRTRRRQQNRSSGPWSNSWRHCRRTTALLSFRSRLNTSRSWKQKDIYLLTNLNNYSFKHSL